MALAGPAANLILAVVAGVAIHIGIAIGTLAAPSSISFTRVVDGAPGELSGGIALFLSILFSQNLLLMTISKPNPAGPAGARLVVKSLTLLDVVGRIGRGQRHIGSFISYGSLVPR